MPSEAHYDRAVDGQAPRWVCRTCNEPYVLGMFRRAYVPHCNCPVTPVYETPAEALARWSEAEDGRRAEEELLRERSRKP